MSKTSDSKTETAKHHISLYRKYRPENFKEVVGQEHIVSVLEKSIEQGTLAHAYAFCGSRGTGKTSIARIFAKAIGTSSNDLYEIDAASNTSVDDIRALTEAVNTVPLESKYKVYILDEVHMLSKAAFNAFLKTLEEPPKHVIFILATTEVEKLPETIVSRCEVYTFKKPTVETLKQVVTRIAKKEGSEIEPEAAELIALLGDGSFRDTLGALQKALSSVGEDKSLTLKEVEDITNAPKSSLVYGFIGGLIKKDAALSIKSLHTALESNIDPKLFAKLSLEKLRGALLLAIGSGAGFLGEADKKELSEIIKDSSPAHIATTIRKMLDMYHAIGKTYIPTLPLEVVVGEVCGI